MADKMHVTHLRKIVRALDPDSDVTAHGAIDHPIDAVQVVLLTAAILGTINVVKLASFTGYSRQFISAIALNMKNNHLWINGQYKCSEWFDPEDGINHAMFHEHNDIACGSRWKPYAEPISVDACQIYWTELEKQSKQKFKCGGWL